MKKTLPAITVVLVILNFPGCHFKEQSKSDSSASYFSQKRPTDLKIPFAYDMLTFNQQYYTRSITFSPDGKEAYWSVIDLRNGLTRWIVWSKLEKGKWTEPQLASFSKKGFEDDVPCISPDGHIMVFISRRPQDDTSKIGKENIWMMNREGETWSEPELLPDEVNNTGNMHQQMSIDEDNNLFFACETEDNGMDIFYSTDVNGTYQKPIRVGSVINSRDHEWSPFISADGSYLIFTRSVGEAWTLYISFREENGNWTTPVKLDSLLKDLDGKNLDGAFVTRDNNYLIFYIESENECIPFWIGTSFLSKISNNIRQINF
jgi:hypothetical protein